jgi:AraC-like DNA-binding protein/mannose-6-phosphate isomerase-like protein (cupin superfamily)
MLVMAFSPAKDVIVPTQYEAIHFTADETFRLLRWTKSVAQVSIIHGGVAKPIQGHGDQWHYHRAMELTFVERGEGTRFVGDRIELYEAGDIVLIGANVPHYWHSHGSSAGWSVQWDFPPESGIWRMGEAMLPLRKLAEAALRGLHLRGDTALRSARAITGLSSPTGLARLSAFFHLLAILSTAPAGDVRKLAARPFSMHGTPEQQEAVSRAVSYILAHYKENVRLEELLLLTGMSRATFARQFKRHAGKSFSAFLNQARLQGVCRALLETEEPISAIALKHGFNQLSFFNRLFRRETGSSPRVYRDKAGYNIL